MANIWEHPDIIAQETLSHLEDALVVTRMCARDTTSEFTTRANGWKKGDTISFRTNGEYRSNDFTGTIDIQDIQSSSRALTIEKHLDISVEVTSREETLDLDSFSDQVIRPAAYKLAEDVDLYVASKILQGAGLYVSTSLFGSAADIAQARKTATIQQLTTSRFCLVDLETEATLLGQEWFNQAQTRGSDGERTMRTGAMGTVMGMDWFSAITFPQQSQVCGDGTAVTDNGGGVNNKIGATVLTINSVGAAGTVNAGDRIYIAGCRRPVIAAVTVDLTVSTQIPLVDPITELIDDAAAITVIAAGETVEFHGAIFDDRSLAVAFPMLDKPGDKVTATASNNGVAIRIVKGYDMTHKRTTLSMDLLCGAFAFDPRRITLVGQIV